MTAPIAFKATRYRCPFCPRTGSSKARVTEHMSRCWTNPEARGCKTCEHFRDGYDACGCEPGCNWGNSGEPIPESCAAGVDLTGRPQCVACKGWGTTPGLGVTECPECGGDGSEIKPGPIVHCPKWELKTEEDA